LLIQNDGIVPLRAKSLLIKFLLSRYDCTWEYAASHSEALLQMNPSKVERLRTELEAQVRRVITTDEDLLEVDKIPPFIFSELQGGSLSLPVTRKDSCRFHVY
jgi:hypothetical protein